MPNTKSNSRREVHETERSRRGKLPEKSMSFHGRAAIPAPAELRRPKTLPELLSSGKYVAALTQAPPPIPRLTKLLLNVTIQGSLGAVQVVMTPDSTVGDLIVTALRHYGKEGRRPLLPSSDASGFDLHYSQFSLESLGREEKLIVLGSRNFFLCPKRSAATDGGQAGGTSGGKTPSCSREANTATKSGFQWLRFMDFLK